MEAFKKYRDRMESIYNRGSPQVTVTSESEQRLNYEKNKLGLEIESLRRRLKEREKELEFSLKAMHIIGIPFVPVETIEQQIELILSEIEQKQKQLAQLENYR